MFSLSFGTWVISEVYTSTCRYFWNTTCPIGSNLQHGVELCGLHKYWHAVRGAFCLDSRSLAKEFQPSTVNLSSSKIVNFYSSSLLISDELFVTLEIPFVYDALIKILEKTFVLPIKIYYSILCWRSETLCFLEIISLWSSFFSYRGPSHFHYHATSNTNYSGSNIITGVAQRAPIYGFPKSRGMFCCVLPPLSNTIMRL